MAGRMSPDSGLAATGTRPAPSAAVRWGAWAGIVYVLAWLTGLFLAPSAPDPFGSAGTINAYFSAHRPAPALLAGWRAEPGCWDYSAGIERQGLSPQAKAATTPAGCAW